MSKQEGGVDLAVIGAGPGGHRAAIAGAKRGLDVLLIDKERIGGVCLHHGCIPAKALIHAAGFQNDIGHWNEIGIQTGDVEVRFEAIQNWKNDAIEHLETNLKREIEARGIETRHGAARFLDSGTLAVETEAGEAEISFENAVIATGSRPFELPDIGFEKEGVISSRELLDIEDVPEELVIVGGGYIGMEAVTKFAKFGTSITVVEARDRVLGMFDPEIVETIEETSEEIYADAIYTSAFAQGVEYEDGRPVLLIDHEGEERRLPAEYIVVAAGRETETNRDSLDLENTNVELEDGVIETDERMRTTDENVFCVGDAAGEPFLAHVAYRQGTVAGAVAAGEDDSYDGQFVPAVMFTDPEVGVVGLSETEATERYEETVTGRFPMSASGRALSANQSAGYTKVIASGDGRLRGVQVVGARASDMTAEATLALEMGASLEDITDTIHAHPTFPEALSDAARIAKDRLRGPP